MNLVMIAGGTFVVIQLTLVILSIVLIMRMGKVMEQLDVKHEKEEKEKKVDMTHRFRYKKLQGNNE